MTKYLYTIYNHITKNDTLITNNQPLVLAVRRIVHYFHLHSMCVMHKFCQMEYLALHLLCVGNENRTRKKNTPRSMSPYK